MNLVIVESPNKCKTIAAILKQLPGEWRVSASVGHIRDLPEKEIGVAAPNFIPQYEISHGKKDVVSKLRQEVKSADVVYLATDPDREGEAIAWHLKEALGLKNPKRVTFNEITEQAVLSAMKNPRTIDMRLVAAQEARRVLDRLVGYTCSGPVSRLAGEKGSAGRVQSPALRLLVEREEAIRSFVPTNHFAVELCFGSDVEAWKAAWDFSPLLPKGAEKYWMEKPFADKVAAIRKVRVVKFEEGQAKLAPPPPFITLTLQQAASQALGFAPDLTMKIAQNLFAAGRITYHRTDNPNLSEETVAEVFAYCDKHNLPKAPSHRKWKAKDGAQMGHPAITPKHLEDESVGENGDERELYRLIRNRAIASQMADAVFDTRQISLESEDAVGDKKMQFKASGRVLRTAGWKSLVARDDASEDDDEMANPIPKLVDGQTLVAADGRVLSKKTMPPNRYTEVSLLKALEDSGIGRPSTYASIISNIRSREYYQEVKGVGKSRGKTKTIQPTPKGEKLVQAMRGRFSFCDYEYTRLMESDLDKVCDGSRDYLTVVKNGHAQLEKELAAVGQDINATYATPSGVVHSCPDCGKPMAKRTASKGANAGKSFWGCTGYPKCSKTAQHDESRDAPVF